MTDIELTRQIAERVMGQSVWFVPDEQNYYWFFRGQIVVFNPLYLIEHAWLVVEKLQELGWTVTLALRQFESQPRDRNVFHGCRMVGTPQTMQRFCDRAESANRAICLAALAAVESAG